MRRGRCATLLAIMVLIASTACAQSARIGKTLPQAGTIAGTAPGQPFNPSPSDGATGQSTSITLSWSCTGAGITGWSALGPNVTTPSTSHPSLSSASYTVTGLTANTTYVWKPTCTNPYGSTALTGAWSFTTAAAGARSVITLADMTLKTYIRLERTSTSQNCNFLDTNGGGFTMKKIGGVNHFYVMQSKSYDERFAPCEFTEPTTFNSSGTCTSANCSTTLSTSPIASLLTNWGVNNDGTPYDFYHGKLGQRYQTGSLVNDCEFSISLPAPGGGCLAYNLHISPDGYTNAIYTTYGASYGNYPNSGGLVMVTMDDANSGGNRVTTAYGPFTVQNPTSVGDAPGQTAQKGLWSANYLVDMPDGTMGHGTGGSLNYQQHASPYGPSLSTSTAWPTNTTPTGATDVIASQKNYLHFYNPDGYINNTTGAIPSGQPSWWWRPAETYPYVYETFGGASWSLAVNPALNSGIGSFNDVSNVGTCILIRTTTKQGFLCFMQSGTNHLAGNTTSCNDLGSGKGFAAHVWYCPGSPVGSSGVACAGAGGDQKSPQYQCHSPYIVTGPTTTWYEPRWLIYDFDTTLTSVSNGTTTDYTVEAASTIFPLSDISSAIPYAPGPNRGSTASAVAYLTGGVAYDSDTNILYLLNWNADSTTQFSELRPVIVAIHIAQ